MGDRLVGSKRSAGGMASRGSAITRDWRTWIPKEPTSTLQWLAEIITNGDISAGELAFAPAQVPFHVAVEAHHY